MKQVKYYYEDEGWYAEAGDEHFVETDSLKADFGVAVDLYDEDQADELHCALQVAYPGYRLIRR